MKKDKKRKSGKRDDDAENLNQPKSLLSLSRVGVLMLATAYLVYYFGITAHISFIFPDEVFASSQKNFSSKCQDVPCSKDYADHPVFPGCTPFNSCGRCVKDGLLTASEVELLKSIAQRGLAYGGSSGGASILDLHSGALSKGEKFINIYQSLPKEELSETFDKNSIETYIKLKNRIHQTIASHFNIKPSALFLTKPTFFSRMTAQPAKTQHDEYWHKHIDKIQYGSFDYTALIYLATYSKEFDGGQFVFDDAIQNITIEPKKGRVSFFTSGSENPHHVERILSGTRYALTIAFTCDPAHAIKDPSFFKSS